VTRRLPVLLAVLAVLAICACGTTPTSAGASPSPSPTSIQHGKITVGGQARTYRLFRPPSLDAQHPAPLVLLLHGCASSGDQFATVTQFDEQASKTGFVAVYPDGLADFGSGFDHCWNEFLDQSKADDFGFLSQLLDRLTADQNIDKNRVYVAGLQSGGHMAYTLACAMPDRIAGIASVSGGMPLDGRKSAMRCPASGARLSRPVSVMEMHGTADTFIPYTGGGGLDAPPTEDLIRYWAALDGCSGDPSVNQNGTTKITLWKHCGGSAAVRLDTVIGGDNRWYTSPAGPDASSVVASWFFNSIQ
jgi:polyhydroxybutyrate depolymerase